ncbi:2-oxo-4-hydroxy-4-carboxy-5-ureidoimidazoline decarboxylase [Mycolicibacterium peregrinum]|uniref:2-oxo-4-hydroxy-4-carboxy-5-ureidoimidazoline decarboxylase n=1 Tax=Mycolicibacterium peregrinum TaxID=43304 RepID=A0A1A0W0B3_MYCPR|nr:2-oxo-4-hydroxy-4-carboxy-5-ureidoimidazoline decarboxylase [Mycolicibacterium peregrinum]OBB88933.1 2-oxo-4-hydroxy-4-carboxy-5-ureidoimidazoline decarboxylase [Mycolicibacterium peregrinum]OBF42633.1 2-oxo-4-hydroxy-4-carboxy-5-ureidoimidazoline decarboxylase [Mycolicibacterium peregrinum]
MHQGLGLEAYNALPTRRAVHAVYECCYSVVLATDLAGGRPFADHAALFRQADALLFSLGEDSIDRVLQAYPHIGRRPRSPKSVCEQCSVWDDDPAVMTQLNAEVQHYAERFGFGFVMFVEDGAAPAATSGAGCAHRAMAAIIDRLHHDRDTERKVVRNELARINRARLERMLGPEGGYYNW